MFKYVSIIMVSILITSCSVNNAPANLLGNWEKVGYGQVLHDGSEYIEDAQNIVCPNDSYEFKEDHTHFVRTYDTLNPDCLVDYSNKRDYKVEDNKIIVNNGEYLYTIEELKPEFLKLYLHQHEFSDTTSDDNETIFIYTFIKSKKLK